MLAVVLSLAAAAAFAASAMFIDSGDGDAVLAALRADPRTVRMPFIFMTASADHSERAARLAQGASDYLVKPIEFKVLLDAIARQLRTDGAPT